MAGRAQQRGDGTLPNLVANVPVSREWKMMMVSSRSHTNTRCRGYGMLR